MLAFSHFIELSLILLDWTGLPVPTWTALPVEEYYYWNIKPFFSAVCTQEFAASSLGVSRQAYSHYENARAIPPNDTCYKIAKLYSIPVEMLIELSLQTNHSEFSNTPHTDTTELDNFLDYIDTEKKQRTF